MAWYPGAVKMELQPESDSQTAIKPTQFIVHSIVAPWSARRTYEYWRDSTNLESHFGIDYDGVVGQYIGTETRADANAGANRRADGTGAVSAETASNTSGSDPWNDKQIEDLIAIGAWLHKEHDLPLRICRSHSDPGFGYHSMFPQWSTSGTACPGKARIKQFREVVFPGIVARASGSTPPKPGATEPRFEPFPGSTFFMAGKSPALGKKSKVFTEMGKRLVAVGCGRYQVGPGPTLGTADVASYEAWQRKCGYSGAAAKWPPGKATWDLLKVPNV